MPSGWAAERFPQIARRFPQPPGLQFPQSLDSSSPQNVAQIVFAVWSPSQSAEKSRKKLPLAVLSHLGVQKVLLKLPLAV